MTLDDEVRRAGKARELLDNELFKDAVKAIEEALLLGVRQSALKDADLREKLMQQYIALQTIVGQLRSHIDTGALAAEEIRRKTIAERFTEFVSP